MAAKYPGREEGIAHDSPSPSTERIRHAEKWRKRHDNRPTVENGPIGRKCVPAASRQPPPPATSLGVAENILKRTFHDGRINRFPQP